MDDWAAHTKSSKMTLLSCWLLMVHHKTENTAIPLKTKDGFIAVGGNSSSFESTYMD